MKRNITRAWMAGVLGLWVSACAGLPLSPDPPEVTLSSLEVIGFGVAEQRYRIGLRIRNPNSYGLSVQGLRYEVKINEVEFARGRMEKPVTIPAGGEAVVSVEAVSRLLAFLSELTDRMDEDADRLTYSLSGEVQLAGRSLRIPFEHKGEVKLAPEDLPAE